MSRSTGPPVSDPPLKRPVIGAYRGGLAHVLRVAGEHVGHGDVRDGEGNEKDGEGHDRAVPPSPGQDGMPLDQNDPPVHAYIDGASHQSALAIVKSPFDVE